MEIGKDTSGLNISIGGEDHRVAQAPGGLSRYSASHIVLWYAKANI